MPVGTVQNPVLAIIAGKLHLSRVQVISVFTACGEYSSEENKKSKNREELQELISFTLGEASHDVGNTLDALMERGLIDAQGALAGIEIGSTDAARARRYREKQRSERDASRDGHVTEKSASHDASRIDQTRPDQKDQKDQKDPLTPNGGEGSGSFKKVGVVGSGQGFDIREHLNDEDFEKLRLYVNPSWDRRAVFEKYNGFVANDPPKAPRVAFFAWANKNAHWLKKQP